MQAKTVILFFLLKNILSAVFKIAIMLKLNLYVTFFMKFLFKIFHMCVIWIFTLLFQSMALKCWYRQAVSYQTSTVTICEFLGQKRHDRPWFVTSKWFLFLQTFLENSPDIGLGIVLLPECSAGVGAQDEFFQKIMCGFSINLWRCVWVLRCPGELAAFDHDCTVISHRQGRIPCDMKTIKNSYPH